MDPNVSNATTAQYSSIAGRLTECLDQQLSNERQRINDFAVVNAGRNRLQRNFVAQVRLSPQLVEQIFPLADFPGYIERFRTMLQSIEKIYLDTDELVTELSAPEYRMVISQRPEIEAKLGELLRARFTTIGDCILFIRGDVDVLKELRAAFRTISIFSSDNEADTEDILRFSDDLPKIIDDWENGFWVDGEIRVWKRGYVTEESTQPEG